MTTDFTPTVTLPSLAVQIVQAVARKALTAAAASLVTLGVLPDDQTTQFVTVGAGLVLGVVSLAWTYIEKRNGRITLAQAVASPAAVAVDHAGETVAVPTPVGGQVVN